jgi:hypothetical protein
MKTSHAAFLALASFAFGILAGRLDLVSKPNQPANVSPSSQASFPSTSTTLPAGHPAVAASRRPFTTR